MIAALGLAALLVAPSDSFVVSAEALRRELDHPDLVVLHASMSEAEYDAGHLPGARFADVMRFHGHQAGDRFLPVADLVAALEALGVSNATRVVLVGDPMAAALVFVALDYLGHGPRTAVLDGGLAAWRAAGGAVSTTPAEAPKRARFEPRVREDMVVDAEWIAARRGSASLALLDARTAGEYRGQSDVGVERAGHIPGAQHLHWVATLTGVVPAAGPEADNPPEGARLKARPELERLLVAKGATPDREVVAYCTVGMRASHLYFVARMLGRRARLYVGSMADWSSRTELPVERP
ncbi:MAG: sulfurtransferase [Gemmatimonadales bacterium]